MIVRFPTCSIVIPSLLLVATCIQNWGHQGEVVNAGGAESQPEDEERPMKAGIPDTPLTVDIPDKPMKIGKPGKSPPKLNPVTKKPNFVHPTKKAATAIAPKKNTTIAVSNPDLPQKIGKAGNIPIPASNPDLPQKVGKPASIPASAGARPVRVGRPSKKPPPTMISTGGGAQVAKASSLPEPAGVITATTGEDDASCVDSNRLPCGPMVNLCNSSRYAHIRTICRKSCGLCGTPKESETSSLPEPASVENYSLPEPASVENYGLPEPATAAENYSLPEPSAAAENYSLPEPASVENYSLPEPAAVAETSSLPEPASVENYSLPEPAAAEAPSLPEPAAAEAPSLPEPAAPATSSLPESEGPRATIATNNTVEASCVDNLMLPCRNLVSKCNSANQGAKVRKFCPVSCGLCTSDMQEAPTVETSAATAPMANTSETSTAETVARVMPSVVSTPVAQVTPAAVETMAPPFKVGKATDNNGQANQWAREFGTLPSPAEETRAPPFKVGTATDSNGQANQWAKDYGTRPSPTAAPKTKVTAPASDEMPIKAGGATDNNAQASQWATSVAAEVPQPSETVNTIVTQPCVDAANGVNLDKSAVPCSDMAHFCKASSGLSALSAITKLNCPKTCGLCRESKNTRIHPSSRQGKIPAPFAVKPVAKAPVKPVAQAPVKPVAKAPVKPIARAPKAVPRAVKPAPKATPAAPLAVNAAPAPAPAPQVVNTAATGTHSGIEEFDLNTDGFITPNELDIILSNMHDYGESWTQADIEGIVQGGDANGDGYLTIGELEQWMNG